MGPSLVQGDRHDASSSDGFSLFGRSRDDRGRGRQLPRG
jgi:hypothetical protein